MPLLQQDQLSRLLEKGERGGVFFLFGAEEFLKEEAITKIVDAHLDPATRDFNFDQFDAASGNIDTLASILQTPPLLAEWRVVVVRGVQALAGAPRGRTLLEQLLERDMPGLVVVLSGQIPDRSKAQIYDLLKRKARAIEFAPLTGGDLPGWLMTRARAAGVELVPDAARALVAAIGTDVGALERELAKLQDFVGARRRIELTDVETAVGKVTHQDRWEWFDLVGSGRIREARAALPALFDARESGVGLVLGLGTHFIRLALAAAGGEGALQKVLPPHQRWLAGRIAGQAKNWSAAALDRALADLLRADRLLKSASLSEEQVLDELLLRLEAIRLPASAA